MQGQLVKEKVGGGGENKKKIPTDEPSSTHLSLSVLQSCSLISLAASKLSYEES